MAESDNENIERIRELWQQFRYHVVFLLLMILSVIMGFTYQHTTDEEQQRRLNAQLFTLLEDDDDLTLADMEAAHAALADQSTYPELPLVASFAMLSVYLDEGNTDKPEELLQRIIDETDDNGLRLLAVLRLSEVLLSRQAYEEALDLLAENKPEQGRLAILFDERTGDIEFNRGNLDEARAAYSRAGEAAAQQTPFYLPVLRIKIGSLLSSENIVANNAVDDAGNSDNTDESTAGDATDDDTTGDTADEAADGDANQ